MMNYVIGGIIGIVIWQGVTTIAHLVTDGNEEVTMGFGTGVWFIIVTGIGLFLKLIKFDFREHDFKKLYRSFKKNYKKADFNYDQWRKANGKRFISSFNKLNKTPECIEYFRGKNS